MSQTKDNSWSERLRSFVGLGRRRGVEQSAASGDNAEQAPTRRSSKTGEFTFVCYNGDVSVGFGSVLTASATSTKVVYGRLGL